MDRYDVLIVGAGPTGLVLALWLTRFGIRVRIIDRTAGSGTTSRALAVQARTLEFYRQFGIADAALALGRRTPGVNLWARGGKVARVAFETIGEGLTPYPFLFILPQDAHERMLVEVLSKAGVEVERGAELIDFREDEDGVVATVAVDGKERCCRTRYIAGCDGARSRVRDIVGADFPGGTYGQLFYVADIAASGPPMNSELNIALDEADFLAVFPMAGEGRARLVGTVSDERAAKGEALSFEDVRSRTIENLKLEVERVNWFSTYHVHHRVADRFRWGRAFLVGDAAHIHSPAGGQGMNTGIADAINLSWKLAHVLAGRAPDTLLDSYEPERIAFARLLVASTDRAFSIVTAEGRFAQFLRARLAPALLPGIMAAEAVRRLLFRTVSQTRLNYRGGPLSAGEAGAVRGGDRLPWAPAAGGDNFAVLSTLSWQLHVYGAATPELRAWSEAGGLALYVFPWTAAHRKAGLARNAVYLVRPDGYVALADRSGRPEPIARYFADRGITWAAYSA